MRHHLSPRLLLLLLIPLLLAIAWLTLPLLQRQLQLYFLSRGVGT